jgi:hypothetical protein
MTSEELETEGKAIAGPGNEKRWQTVLASRLGTDPGTINRWFHGRNKIKEATAIAIRSLAAEARKEREAS